MMQTDTSSIMLVFDTTRWNDKLLHSQKKRAIHRNYYSPSSNVMRSEH